jgi:hypothetical protein
MALNTLNVIVPETRAFIRMAKGGCAQRSGMDQTSNLSFAGCQPHGRAYPPHQEALKDASWCEDNASAIRTGRSAARVGNVGCLGLRTRRLVTFSTTSLVVLPIMGNGQLARTTRVRGASLSRT